MIYMPLVRNADVEEIILIFQPEIEGLHPEGHDGFTKIMVDLIFDALYDHFRA